MIAEPCNKYQNLAGSFEIYLPKEIRHRHVDMLNVKLEILRYYIKAQAWSYFYGLKTENSQYHNDDAIELYLKAFGRH